MGTRHGKYKVTSIDRAILKVKTQRDTVKIYMKKLEQSLDFEKDLAIQLLQKNDKEKARCILRKRVALLRYLKNTDAQLENLERMICQMENAQIQSKVIDGLKTGSKALQRVLDVLNIKHVESILENSGRGFEKLEEINQLLTGLNIEQDENDELEKELERLAEQSSVVVIKTPTPSDVLPTGMRKLRTNCAKKLRPIHDNEDPAKPSTSSSKRIEKIRGRVRVSPPRMLDGHGIRQKEMGIVINN